MSLPGRFLSRRHFMLCITVEVEPRIAKQYKCQYCCSCKKLPWKGGGGWGGEKVSSHRFLADQEIVSSEAEKKKRKKSVLGHPIARATSYRLLPDTF